METHKIGAKINTLKFRKIYQKICSACCGSSFVVISVVQIGLGLVFSQGLKQDRFWANMFLNADCKK